MLSDFIEEHYGTIIRKYEEQHQKFLKEKQLYQEQNQISDNLIRIYDKLIHCFDMAKQIHSIMDEKGITYN